MGANSRLLSFPAPIGANLHPPCYEELEKDTSSFPNPDYLFFFVGIGIVWIEFSRDASIRYYITHMMENHGIPLIDKDIRFNVHSRDS